MQLNSKQFYIDVEDLLTAAEDLTFFREGTDHYEEAKLKIEKFNLEWSDSLSEYLKYTE